MRYILKSRYALRSYDRLPHMLLRKFEEDAAVLLADEWDILMECDGKTELDPLKEEFIRSSRIGAMIEPAEEGAELSGWQKDIYHDNIYFPAVEWRITDRCNLNCLHCYNASDLSANADMWELDEAYEFLDQARECGIHEIRLSGGEPMMHKDFMKIVAAIYDRDMYVGQIVTNGYYLTQEILDELASFGHKPLFKVSFDGFGYHDWIRDHEGAEKDAIRAFELLRKNDFPILVNAQINRRNRSSFAETLEYFDALGVKTLRFIRTTEVPRWQLLAGDAAMTYEEYYDVMLEVLREYVKKPRKMSLILWEFAMVNPERRSFRMIHNSCSRDGCRDTMSVCRTMRKQVCVGAGGNIYPCSQMSGILDARGICLGNVKKDGLKSLLKEGRYIDIATMTVGDVRKRNEKCAACGHFSQCHGGCRGLALLYTGDIYGENPAMCNMIALDRESEVIKIMKGWKDEYPGAGHESANEGIDQC